MAGLSQQEAARRYGPNLISQGQKPHWLRRLAANLSHFFALLLWAAAALALIGGLPPLAVAIVVVILINAIFAFIQEYRAERAIESLAEILPDRARVIRDDREEEIDASAVVRGDLVVLRRGGRVPADGYLIEAEDLRADLSPLTGESVPVELAPSQDREKTLENHSLIFAGSYIVFGSGKAIITDIGDDSEIGRVASLTEKTLLRQSPLAKEMRHITRLVAALALTIGLLFFLVAGALDMSLNERFLFAIGVIVALVPEGLLPTTTLALALSTKRMAERKALVRRLSAVETLGETTVLCTDKTGTLTTNQMTASRIWAAAGVEVREVIEAGLICNDALVEDGDIIGDPTDIALAKLAEREEVARPRYPRLDERPFSSEEKIMITLNQVGSNRRVYLKGAAMAIMPRLSQRYQIKSEIEKMERSGLRVIVLAAKDCSDIDQAESGARLLGAVGIYDPPRPEAKEAVETFRNAGIRLLLITGDSGLTAEAIAREVGLIAGKGHIVEGSEVKKFDDQQLLEATKAPQAIFARTSPEDKLRIARVLQDSGQVVAMTGDGVNDAPALRAADIGIAMGQSGTDVARNAADIILLDDNITSVGAAIEEGRAVYDNIRRFAQYHFSSNTAELMAFLLWGLSGGLVPLPLVVMQVLAIDLGSDLLPALALGSERGERGILKRPPRRQGERLLNFISLARVFFFVGLLVGVAGLVSFFLATPGKIPPGSGEGYLRATALTYAAIILGQVGAALALRTNRQSVFQIGILSNRFLLVSFAVSISLMLSIIYLPPLQSIFHTADLAPTSWIWLAAWPLVVFFADEGRKAVIRAK